VKRNKGKKDSWEENEKWQALSRKNTELRQQTLDRDSARDKEELDNKTHNFRKAIDYKIRDDNNSTDNRMKYLEKVKNDCLAVLDGQANVEKIREDAERLKLLAANENCEITINNAIDYGIPISYKKRNNDYKNFLF